MAAKTASNFERSLPVFEKAAIATLKDIITCCWALNGDLIPREDLMPFYERLSGDEVKALSIAEWYFATDDEDGRCDLHSSMSSFPDDVDWLRTWKRTWNFNVFPAGWDFETSGDFRFTLQAVKVCARKVRDE